MIEKLKACFGEMIVYKDLKKGHFFSTLSLPSFMRDWLLKRFEDEDGNFSTEDMAYFIQAYLPRKENWKDIKNRIVKERERVKLLAKISGDINIKTGQVSFSLPDFNLSSDDTIVEDSVWDNCKSELVRGGETWGMVELGYRSPEDGGTRSGKGAGGGKIKLIAFKTFCPYVIDVDYYKSARQEFTTAEWIDLLLGAIDYNADGYRGDIEQKLTMLTRLLPFVEKRVNLVELAPKGTGKSYVFGQVSRFGWLSSGGKMSRAKLFYDIGKRAEGLVCGNDFVTLDEVQTIEFTDANDMTGTLKGYLESGSFNVANHEGVADAGIIICGNIKKETMDQEGFTNMFDELPAVFRESALIERIHGFIKGWKIPRMNEDLKVAGWALNSEYFTSILHELRTDMTYRAIVDDLLVVPKAADTRDTEAVKRIATAYLKLLFPHVRSVSDVNIGEFKRYCLSRANKMRGLILYQLGLIDEEYRGKEMPRLEIRSSSENS